MEELRVFAPATVANLGPGFDVLGMALERPGDVVTVRPSREPGVRIASIAGDGGALPTSAAENTAGIAALEVLRRAGSDAGFELAIEKRMPLGSGLGSSAASAAAAAFGVNAALGEPLAPEGLIACCVEAEAAVSGRHADNAAPSLLGGLVLVRRADPPDVARLPVPAGLTVTVVTPRFELPTRAAREALPKQVPMGAVVENAADLAALVHALHAGDLALLGRSLFDGIVTPARAPLIPGCATVIEAAREAGALGSSISGAGPSIFALARDTATAQRAAEAMRGAFATAGLESTAVVGPAGAVGARIL